MSQKKILLYSPDGKEEQWFMEDVAPADWLRTKPEVKEEIEGDVLPGGGDPNLKGYDPPEPELSDDERLAEAERLTAEGKSEEADDLLYAGETQ